MPLTFGVGDIVSLQDGFGYFLLRGEIIGIRGFSEHFIVFEVAGCTLAYGVSAVPNPRLDVNEFVVPRERARRAPGWTTAKWMVDARRVLLKQKGMLWMGEYLDRRDRMERDVPLECA